MDKIRLARGLQTDSIVDGAGLRCVLWTQGCYHNCKGCHNPTTHDGNGGELFDVETVLTWMKRYAYHDGITFSGGEPFLQVEPLIEIAKEAKAMGWNIWCYTGYVYEQLLEDEKKRALLSYIDVLVDGPFILEEKSMSVPFRGSKNQRLIDVKRSLERKEIVEL
ncbi:MAG: anaerobic ribonucleoside-triphosphate reductase activating protein [Erysipelotrichaceae bacterium]|nr:anaerobic ribonucleoside-triphosphate reductase activating protein [Erysipelotrichaceae bacterium]